MNVDFFKGLISTGNAMRSSFARHRSQAGTTLIEVLVTVLILSIGFLGLAAMQLMGLRASQQSLQQSLVTMYSYSILDSMRANRSAARAGSYNVTNLCAAPADPTANLVASDQAFWVNAFQRQLGDTACGNVNCTSAGVCEITLSWTEARDRLAAGSVTTRTNL